MITLIQEGYSNISNALNLNCLSRESDVEEINYLRNLYLSKLDALLVLNGGILENYLDAMREFLN